MGPIILAVFVIVLGAVIRVAGPASGKPGAAGSANRFRAARSGRARHQSAREHRKDVDP